MQAYLDVLAHVMKNGAEKSDRTGTGTRSVFGAQMRFDLNAGFPLVTTKKLHLRSIIHELLWFLKGETNIAYLKENKVSIWDEWADANGDLGPVYGKQWRSWQCPDGSTIDQIQWLVDEIKRNPDSRRLIVNAWNVPFNIASYALLTHMIAQVCDLGVGDFVHTLGDAHIYSNHFEQVNEQLSRTPRSLPSLHLNPGIKNLFEFSFDDIRIDHYDPLPAIKAPVAV